MEGKKAEGIEKVRRDLSNGVFRRKTLLMVCFYTEISKFFLPMLNDEEELKWLREMSKNERGRCWKCKDYD